MVRVDYYENAKAKKEGNVLGTFSIDIVPDEVPEVDSKLKGEKLEKAITRREQKLDEAIKNCQFTALDKVREIVGLTGVLVATIIEEEENDEGNIG